MFVCMGLFKVKNGQLPFALKHMRHHLNIVQKSKGFIHGYIAHATDRKNEFLVVEEYKTTEAQQKAQEMLFKDSKTIPSDYIKFNKIMEEKPFLAVFKKQEIIKTKGISKDYQIMLKKLEEKKHIKQTKKKGKKRK